MRLAKEQWESRRAAHEARVDALTHGRLQRAARGDADPVDDFLFTYYRHSPGRLRRWSPGAGVVLEGHPATEPFVAVDGGAVLGPAPAHLVEPVARVLSLTSEAQPQYGCFGLHEWAMVHGGGQRHEGLPLRLGQQRTDAVVEQLGVRCSHFDAHRFFTPSARPLNSLRPDRDRGLEQPGCLHTNMDLYKWAYKLSPWVPSELVVDCFELARRIRVLDMQASPYELESNIAIETAQGRAEYQRKQRSFADEAAHLRRRLLDALTPVEV